MTEPRAPDPEPVLLGVTSTPFRDLYHLFLRLSWPRALAVLVAMVVAVNLVFGVAFFVVGGISEARPGSFADAFFFSSETFATIGYGAMHPVTFTAHVLVTIEATLGLVATALITGLVFAKFTLSTARIVFSHRAAIAPMNGVPTLMFRIGNERGNTVVESQIRVALSRREVTHEGEVFYRMHDLRLARDRTSTLTRAWTVMHPITEDSPLHGVTPDELVRDEVELFATVLGTDDTSLQPVYGTCRYDGADLAFGMRLADILGQTDDGRFTVDLRKFHALTPTKATARFPYSDGVRADGGESTGE